MSGQKPFSELTKDWSEDRLQRVEAKKAQLREEMSLQEPCKPTIDNAQEET